jgi:hypothetical protein
MTIKEWKKAPKELQGWKNYQFARKELWFGMIEQMKLERPNVKIVLHHINVNDQNYENWWPVVPMFIDDHTKLHSKGKKISEETKEKISKANSIALKGNIPWNKGKVFSKKKKIRCGDCGKEININKTGYCKNCVHKYVQTRLEVIDKIRKSNLGKKHIMNKTNPHWKSGWKHTDEAKEKIGKQSSRSHWYTNGIINKFCHECPDGFFIGITLSEHAKASYKNRRIA